ncbi:MAG: hypothetical protein E7527_00370 [Ruminococcaceae bacterium]|nr:hypothetical protein [Oscillospiraceae bacterium]
MKKRTKKTISVAISVFTRVLLGIVLCAILNVSMNAIAVGIFGNEVGYRVIEEDKSTGAAKYVPELEYRYKPGETSTVRDKLKLVDNEKIAQVAEPIIEPSATTKTIMDILSQVLMLVVLGIFPYHILWQFGNRDDTNVRYKGQRPDPWRGVKVGALAMIPFAALWIVLVVARFTGWDDFLSIYSLISFPYINYNTWVLGASTALANVAVWRLFLLLPTLLFVPAVSGIAYRMGGNQFSIAEFITFKKAKETKEEEEI